MARNPEDRSQRGQESRGSQGNLEDRSIDELRDMAGDLGIQGRDRLDRQQLIQQIQTQQRQGQGGERQGQGGERQGQSGERQGQSGKGQKRQ